MYVCMSMMILGSSYSSNIMKLLKRSLLLFMLPCVLCFFSRTENKINFVHSKNGNKTAWLIIVQHCLET